MENLTLNIWQVGEAMKVTVFNLRACDLNIVKVEEQCNTSDFGFQNKTFRALPKNWAMSSFTLRFNFSVTNF